MLFRYSASFLILGILLAACASNLEKMDEVPAAQQPAATPVLNNPISPTHNGTSTDIDAQQLLVMLTSEGEQSMNDALVLIVEQGDQRFVSVMIELMGVAQIGLIRSLNCPALTEALER